MSTPASAGTLTIELEDHCGAVVARLIGSANMVSASDLQDQLLDIIQRKPRRLVLDLSQLDFISSVGLGGIIAAHLRCRRFNTSIALAGPQPDILDLLEVTNLNRLFPIHPSVDAAVADLPN